MIDLKCPYPDLAQELKKLPEREQYYILQAVSNLRISNMEPNREVWIDALDIATGRKTSDQIRDEIIQRYRHT